MAEAVNDYLTQGLKGKSPETVSNYRSLATHHLIPHIGAAKLKKLTADELDTWMDDRAEELSTRTLRLIHQILERAIRHAQARDKVRRNVASLITVPEGQEGRPSKSMTREQAMRLLHEVGQGSKHRLAAYVVLSLLVERCTEEARALTWADVDLTAGTVAVYRSVRAKGDTKTRRSRRVLKLPTRATDALKEHRKHQAAEQLAAGEQWQDHGLVFCRADGIPLDCWQVRREFAPLTSAAGTGSGWRWWPAGRRPGWTRSRSAVAAAAMALAATTPAVVVSPSSIEIPSIHVNAPVIPLGVTPPTMKDFKEQAPKAVCYPYVANVPRTMLINLHKPPFDNIELRKATVLSLDRKAFVDILDGGMPNTLGATMPPRCTSRVTVSSSSVQSGYDVVVTSCPAGM